MKNIVFAILILPNLLLSNEYRAKLDSALKYEKAADKYILELEKKLTTENLAYYGVICIMKSNHAGFPYTKLKYFYRGKKHLEKAITLYPNNIEFIYYRYEIQIKIPAGLNYDNKAEDLKKLKQFIVNKENQKSDPSLYTQILKIIS
jgi:tetratricopeptide (TPR) repeat protein